MIILEVVGTESGKCFRGLQVTDTSSGHDVQSINFIIFVCSPTLGFSCLQSVGSGYFGSDMSFI